MAHGVSVPSGQVTVSWKHTIQVNSMTSFQT